MIALLSIAGKVVEFVAASEEFVLVLESSTEEVVFCEDVPQKKLK